MFCSWAYSTEHLFDVKPSAQILGAAGLGRVEAGPPATFVVTSKPLFDKNGKVAYTFVEGVMEKGADITSKPANTGRGGAR